MKVEKHEAWGMEPMELMKNTWRHTEFLDRGRLVHTAASRRPALALSSGEVSGWFFWPRAYVVKKGHARHIFSNCRRALFWRSSAPSSLIMRCYLFASAFHPLYWLLLSHQF
jgi:hypothetical protein